MTDQEFMGELSLRMKDPLFLQEQLLSANNELRRVKEYSKKLENEIEAIAPMKNFYIAVTESDDWMEFSAGVKVLGVKGFGRNKVLELLRDRKILRYNNEPYQEYVERGYFKTIEQIFDNPQTGETMINRKPMMSQKGLDFIRKIIREEK
jgi:anti-repressor protein